MGETRDAAATYRRVSAHAASLGAAIAPEELAELAVRHDMGVGELAALDAVFSYLADKRHDQVIETLLKLSRLPQKAPKTFSGFDFDRIRGRDAAALRKLPALANLRAQEPGVHRAGRDRKDAPGAGLRPGVLPERLQDLLPEGHRAEGQAEEGRRFRKHLARRSHACEALVPHS